MQQSTKKRLKSVVSVLLMLAIAITGALAYFTASDSKKNVFTIGNVDILLHEDDWTENEDGDSNHINGDNINVLPGDKISKAPYIENVGDNNAIVYMTIGIPTFQKNNSRPDSYAIAFDNTNIPVNAYAVQEMYGNLTDVNEIWDAYCQNEAADMFGTAVTDEAALLDRIELFNLPADVGSGWTQLGEVFKSEDGFNYYTFAYNTVIEPTAKTSEIIEWVQLNPALTENNDVLFSAGDNGTGFYAPVMNYYSKNNIGADKAAEIYGVPREGDIVLDGMQGGILDEEGNLIPDTPSEDIPSMYKYEYAGAIKLDYVPEQDDAYYVSNANAMLTFNATSSQWEVIDEEENPIDTDLIPDTILNKETYIINPATFDPDPDHATPQIGDEWEDDDYIYKYGYEYNRTYWRQSSKGWGVGVKDTTKTSYGPIKREIWGEPVESLNSTFFGCSSLIEAPEIPANVINVVDTFYGCSSLTTATKLPESITSLSNTFSGCHSLIKAPEIPESVTIMAGAFTSCKSLTTAPKIPDGVTNMSNTFSGCTSLTLVPNIPDSVTNMSYTFYNCPLTTVPDISNAINLTNMSCTFYNCTSLIVAPKLPNSVTNMSNTFMNCSSLVTVPNIPNSVTNMNCTFINCTSLTTVPDMSNVTELTNMTSSFNNCPLLTGTIRIPATVTEIDKCFYRTTKDITMEYYSSCTAAANYSATSNITKVCIDA